jgi:hypothetical protein
MASTAVMTVVVLVDTSVLLVMGRGPITSIQMVSGVQIILSVRSGTAVVRMGMVCIKFWAALSRIGCRNIKGRRLPLSSIRQQIQIKTRPYHNAVQILNLNCPHPGIGGLGLPRHCEDCRGPTTRQASVDATALRIIALLTSFQASHRLLNSQSTLVYPPMPYTTNLMPNPSTSRLRATTSSEHLDQETSGVLVLD